MTSRVLSLVICFALVSGVPATIEKNLKLYVSFNAEHRTPRQMKAWPHNFSFIESGRSVNFESGVYEESLGLNGEYFLLARSREVPSSCLSDVDLCKEGFTLSVWVRPASPWEGGMDPEFLVSFGAGEDVDFGLKLAFRRKTLFARALGRQLWQRKECGFHDEENPDAWKHIVVKRKGIDGPLFVYLNGKVLDCEDLTFQPVDKATLTNTQLIIGADSADYGYNMYHGFIDELMFFDTPLDLAVIREIYRAGKESIANNVPKK